MQPTHSPYSEVGEAQRDALFDLMDGLPLWQVQLIWEYGAARTLRMVRLHPTPVACQTALEAERLRNEAARWANGGTLPVGY